MQNIPGIALEGQPDGYDVKTPAAEAMGAVDVSVLNHHGYLDSQNAYFVATFAPGSGP